MTIFELLKTKPGMPVDKTPESTNNSYYWKDGFNTANAHWIAFLKSVDVDELVEVDEEKVLRMLQIHFLPLIVKLDSAEGFGLPKLAKFIAAHSKEILKVKGASNEKIR